MSTTNQFDTLNGLFKEAYADKVKDLKPDGVKLQNMIDFQDAEKLGNLYHQPVVLTFEHGFTYGGSGGSAFALRNAVNAVHQDAQIKGHEMVLRSYVSVGAVSRSTGKNAFIQATKLIVQNMMRSFARRLEVQLFYGQADGGIGVIESITGQVLKIEDHEWASGIWSGAESMPLEIRSSAGALRGEANIVSVNFDNKEVTVDAVPVGVVATDVIYYAGAYSKEFAGIHKIITNSGSLFNIDASQYNLWKGNTVNVGTNFSGGEAVLSFDKVETAVARAMEKGLGEEKVVLICSPLSWKNLLTEQAGKRMYDQSYKESEMKNGARKLTFFSQNGEIEIHASIHCKEGYAYMLTVEDFMRIGSSDLRFDMPGLEGKFIKLLENTNAYEMRCYTDQALFCARPGTSTLLTFIKS